MNDASKKACARMEAAQRKIQAAVAHELALGGDRAAGTTGKSLRVGVNSALVETSAMAVLLVRKGVITEQEYYEALADGMEAEVARYQAALDKHYGPGRVVLGGTLEDLGQQPSEEEPYVFRERGKEH